MSSPTKPRIVVLTGAGISAESGIRTFRASDGLWEEHRIEDVATPEGFKRNPELVHRFYNARRAQLKEVGPNQGHRALVELETAYEVDIVTQNVDDLHERAGSSRVLHLHGELTKVRSTRDGKVYEWHTDLSTTDRCPGGSSLRPHIVWFGEDVPLLDRAASLVAAADVVIIVGTSMKVYPAAGLVGIARREVPVYYVDPYPSINYELTGRKNLTVIEATATEGVPRLVRQLLED